MWLVKEPGKLPLMDHQPLLCIHIARSHLRAATVRPISRRPLQSNTSRLHKLPRSHRDNMDVCMYGFHRTRPGRKQEEEESPVKEQRKEKVVQFDESLKVSDKEFNSCWRPSHRQETVSILS
ncbi:unnamed protein product [Pleuronectes platessa]|uniref:Uncharacterized protein n=1 Tax=Pleuronectes platessa TaxID=8262 RepID=A0A9N7YNS7_PLEPL|nr:unnamed protein product [Pleuronectes platessa]